MAFEKPMATNAIVLLIHIKVLNEILISHHFCLWGFLGCLRNLRFFCSFGLVIKRFIMSHLWAHSQSFRSQHFVKK